MSLQSVLDNILISPDGLLDFRPGTEQQIKDAITHLYNNSEIARGVLERINQLPIRYFWGDNAYYDPDEHLIRIDVEFVERLYFFDENGTLRQHTLADVLIHEIIHAVDGLDDPLYDPVNPPDYTLLNAADFDFLGPTVVKTNLIMEQLYGYIRTSYFSPEVSCSESLTPLRGDTSISRLSILSNTVRTGLIGRQTLKT
jgi:hypothetical protein